MKIKTSYLISPQPTSDIEVKEIKAINYSANLLKVIEPNWKDYIPRNQLRRMGKAVRIGTGAGLKLIEKENSFKKADAIIVTSANGGLEDCIKFLKQMVTYGDGALTPTNFVQSTPNAISGNIAITTANHCYNMTHVNSSFAFIDGLRDASLLLSENSKAKILLGSIDEISDFNYRINELRGHYKKEKIDSLNLLDSKTKGSICGESAAFFGITNSTDKELVNIIGFETLLSKELTEIKEFISQFLSDNDLRVQDVDGLMLGYNGDVSKNYVYDELRSLFTKDINTFSFKDLFGEYPSVVSAGFWYASQLLKNRKPINKPIQVQNNKMKNILIFNQYNGEENSLILLS